jgi:hypothetical protein
LPNRASTSRPLNLRDLAGMGPSRVGVEETLERTACRFHRIRVRNMGHSGLTLAVTKVAREILVRLGFGESCEHRLRCIYEGLGFDEMNPIGIRHDE